MCIRDSLIVGGGYSTEVLKIWRLGVWNCVHTTAMDGKAYTVAVHPVSGNIFAGIDSDTIVELAWNGESTTVVKEYTGHTHWVRSLVIHGVDNVMVSGSDDSTIKLWDIKTGTCRRTTKAHSNYINNVGFVHPDFPAGPLMPGTAERPHHTAGGLRALVDALVARGQPVPRLCLCG